MASPDSGYLFGEARAFFAHLPHLCAQGQGRRSQVRAGRPLHFHLDLNSRKHQAPGRGWTGMLHR